MRVATTACLVETYGTGLEVVRVEVTVEDGMERFGFAGPYAPPVNAVRALRDRVRWGIVASDLPWPRLHIRVATWPALRQIDPAIDLAVAIGVVEAASIADVAVDDSVLLVGTIDKRGLVRGIPGISVEVAERMADRHGFADAIVGNGLMSIGHFVRHAAMVA